MVFFSCLFLLIFDCESDSNQPYIVNTPLICIVSQDFHKENIYSSITLDNGLYNLIIKTLDDEEEIDEKYDSVEELLFVNFDSVKDDILDFCQPIILEPNSKFFPQVFKINYKSSLESIKIIDGLMNDIDLGD